MVAVLLKLPKLLLSAVVLKSIHPILKAVPSKTKPLCPSYSMVLHQRSGTSYGCFLPAMPLFQNQIQIVQTVLLSKPPLLYHGRLSFIRNVNCVNYSFYKNMVYAFVQFQYGFFNKMSAQSAVDSFLYSLFNIIFTSAPLVVYAGLERDASAKHHMEHPEIYKIDGRKKFIMSYANF